MEQTLARNQLIELTNAGGFLAIQDVQTGRRLALNAPSFEIDGQLLGGGAWSFRQVISFRTLANGGTEILLHYVLAVREGFDLLVRLRYFPESPVVRFRYELASSNPVRLTKKNSQDQIVYTGITIPVEQPRLTEIQFSQFHTINHSFLPIFEQKTQDELVEGCSFPGPIAYLEQGEYCVLLSYEHGAQYPDTYLSFQAQQAAGNLEVRLVAEKGNYYHGETVDQAHPFNSVWFEVALCAGGKEQLLQHYRRFFLHYICESPESRKPYLFYNTWNFQERNAYFNDQPYLATMNLERMLAEIDVAHRIGIDVFVIDTGWYQKTGDWTVDLNRFPDGLKQVKAKLDGYGMKLGLWFNPIAVAQTSEAFTAHPEYRIRQNGQDFCNEIWETENSYFMCLASGFANDLARKLVRLNQELGVTYFKWDGMGQYGCDSPDHDHGTLENSAEERAICFSYKMGLAMIRVAEELTHRCPDAIVDFDITEGGRFVGLGFLATGKYFLINNGPYAMDFDLPNPMNVATNKVAVNLWEYCNMFFWPGPARSRVCRQGTQYDSFVPSILFLSHFLPDGPRLSQDNSLASLMLGGNGIWGDLLNLSEADIQVFQDALGKYKRVAESVAASYPVEKGRIGSSPEIYEKIDPAKAKGLVAFFTDVAATYTHITQPLNKGALTGVDGADDWELTGEGRLKITVTLERHGARTVFVG